MQFKLASEIPALIVWKCEVMLSNASSYFYDISVNLGTRSKTIRRNTVVSIACTNPVLQSFLGENTSNEAPMSQVLFTSAESIIYQPRNFFS